MAKSQRAIDCRNCGTKLIGDYCHACGQRADEPRRVFIGLVQDFLVDTLAIDGKLARSIALLLGRPARLARRYLDGRRVHYSPPFRLYLFASVFFFIAAFGTLGTGFQDGRETSREGLSSDIVFSDEAIREIERVDPAAAARMRDIQDAPSRDAEEGSAPADAASGEGAGGDRAEFKPWEDVKYDGPDWLEPHVKKMYEAGQRVADDPRLFLAQTRENLPRVLLLAPVVYALILLLLYFYRRKFYIYDHFVISLYMHAALYAYLLLALLLSLVPVAGRWLWPIPVLWGAIQPFAVFRQAYGSNWVSVIVKGVISTALYLALAIMIITFGLTYSLYRS